MGFLDEIESNVRTKEEVEDEEKIGIQRTSMDRASVHYDEVKNAILNKAKNAEYEILPNGDKKIVYKMEVPKFYFTSNVRNFAQEAKEKQEKIRARYKSILDAENNVAKRQKIVRAMMNECEQIEIPTSDFVRSTVSIKYDFYYSYVEYIKHLRYLAGNDGISLGFELFNGVAHSGEFNDFPVIFNEYVGNGWEVLIMVFSCVLPASGKVTSGQADSSHKRSESNIDNDKTIESFSITASVNDNTVLIEWEKYWDADGYYVLGYDLDSKQVIDLGNTDSTSFSEQVVDDQPYRRYYQVAAFKNVNGVQKYLIFSNTVYAKKNKNAHTQAYENEIDNMEGHDFEHFCATVLRVNGFEQVSVTRGSGDQGVDVLAHKEGIKYGIQCKCYSSDIGNKAVQEAYAGKGFYDCHVGAVLTNQYFTSAAKELAKKNHILLWDRRKLLEMVKKLPAKKTDFVEIQFYKVKDNLFHMKYGEQYCVENIYVANNEDIANAVTEESIPENGNGIETIEKVPSSDGDSFETPQESKNISVSHEKTESIKPASNCQDRETSSTYSAPKYYDEPSELNNNIQNNKGKSKGKLFVILGIIAIVVIAAAVLYLKSNDTQKEVENHLAETFNQFSEDEEKEFAEKGVVIDTDYAYTLAKHEKSIWYYNCEKIITSSSFTDFQDIELYSEDAKRIEAIMYAMLPSNSYRVDESPYKTMRTQSLTLYHSLSDYEPIICAFEDGLTVTDTSGRTFRLVRDVMTDDDTYYRLFLDDVELYVESGNSLFNYDWQ